MVDVSSVCAGVNCSLAIRFEMSLSNILAVSMATTQFRYYTRTT